MYLILGVGGLIVSALGVYYQREAIMNTLRRSPNQTAPSPSVDAVDPPPAIVRAPKRKNREMEQFQILYIHATKTDGLLCFLGSASLTFMWHQTNRFFFGAIADLIHAHNELIRKQEIEEYNDKEDESEDDGEDE